MRSLPFVAIFLGALAACSSSSSSSSDPGPSGGLDAGTTLDAVDVPIDGVTHDELARFNSGDSFFDLALREGDGLGPLYTQQSCGACHKNALRGPGLVQKMSVVEADGITAAPSADQQQRLPYGGTEHPFVTAGATRPILAPDDQTSIKVTTRAGPAALGRGYMEAILDSEIERVEREQAARTDGIHGHINHVVYASEANTDKSFHTHQKGDTVIGRFGLKARIATLDDFTADALQNDMGITSPMRPTEFANPEGLTDDLKPGIDVTLDSVNVRANYVRLIAIPKRDGLTDAGRALFASTQCAACHAPSLKTRADYPLSLLAGIDAPVYTDLLLHDMGDALADGTAGMDGQATSRQWRTAPLIGLRFEKIFLHDGRAHSIRDAVTAHDGAGSEASDSVHRFLTLSSADQQTLLDFVGAL